MTRFGSGLPVDVAEKVDPIMALVRHELAMAIERHGPMRSPHEGYAVLIEEVEELWAEVKARDVDIMAMRDEALQVAAMGIRFVLDVCRREVSR